MELLGSEVAKSIVALASEDISALRANGTPPCLAVIRVGEDGSDISYERGIRKRFEGANAKFISVTLPTDCTEYELEHQLMELNADESVHGIMVFRPLPRHLDQKRIESLIDPEKDVDGMSSESLGRVMKNAPGFPPCTAQAVMELISFYGIPLRGKNVVIVGRSVVVGKPLAMLMLNENATPTVCHTKTEALDEICGRADILAACAGSAHMIRARHVKQGAILLDVGVNVVDNKLMGDIDPEAYPLAAAYTKVPGGVGAVTSAVLLKHTVAAAKRRLIK